MPGLMTAIRTEMFLPKLIQVVLEPIMVHHFMDLIQVLESNAKVSCRKSPEITKEAQMLGSMTALQEETHSLQVTEMLALEAPTQVLESSAKDSLKRSSTKAWLKPNKITREALMLGLMTALQTE